MTGSFNYLSKIEFLDTIEIENIGECCLEANTDLGEFYYLCIHTKLGQTKVLEYGPDIDGIPPNYLYYSFQMFPYSDMKLDKLITKFINRQGITQVREVTLDDVLSKITEPRKFFEDSVNSI